MDLIAYWRVIRRRRLIMFVGLSAALLLALFSLVKPTSSGLTWSGLSWRTPPVYKASTTLLVTQPGFPWGRSTLDDRSASGDTTTVVPRFSDPTRMEYLASLYARIAESDVIAERVEVARDEARPKWTATPIPGAEGRALPLIEIGAFEASPAKAIALANGVSAALRAYLASEQGKNRIAGDDRIELRVIERADEAAVFQGVRWTRPVMIFLLVSILTVALAFVVDNLRGGRAAAARARGELATGLDIVPIEPERPDATEANSAPDVGGRIQPANPRAEEASAETSPAYGRWAQREERLRDERVGLVPGSGSPISQRSGSAGLSLAAASGRPFEAAGSDALRLGDRDDALARLEELWPRLQAESIGFVHIGCSREGTERGIGSIACYASLPQDGGSASIAPSRELVSELDEVAFALLLPEVGAMRNGDVSTLVLDLGQKTATLHEGWLGTHDTHGQSGSRRSHSGGSA